MINSSKKIWIDLSIRKRIFIQIQTLQHPFIITHIPPPFRHIRHRLQRIGYLAITINILCKLRFLHSNVILRQALSRNLRIGIDAALPAADEVFALLPALGFGQRLRIRFILPAHPGSGGGNLWLQPALLIAPGGKYRGPRAVFMVAHHLFIAANDSGDGIARPLILVGLEVAFFIDVKGTDGRQLIGKSIYSDNFSPFKPADNFSAQAGAGTLIGAHTPH
ncbi:hypothetical protein ABW13_04975 [Pluralibacter gergoviae]|nr:hypothetical protein ABW13_04975 [Pluralibacter gergoviae]